MKIAAIIVGVAVAILAIVYYTNPSAAADINEMKRQWSEWTPEKIQANPVGYLNFAKDELNKSKDKLEARLISFRAQKAKFSRKAKEAEVNLNSHTANLKLGKETYISTKETDSWPVMYKKQPLSEKELKQYIVQGNKAVKKETKLFKSYSSHVAKVSSYVGKMEAELEKLVEKSADLDTKIEMVKANEELKSVEEITDKMLGLLDGVEGVVGDTSAPSFTTINQSEGAGEAELDLEFEAIMDDGGS